MSEKQLQFLVMALLYLEFRRNLGTSMDAKDVIEKKVLPLLKDLNAAANEHFSDEKKGWFSR